MMCKIEELLKTKPSKEDYPRVLYRGDWLQRAGVGFRRSLPGTVSRPVNAVEDELNRARVEEVDVAFLETGEYGWVSDADEFRAEAAEIVQHLPVQRLHHRRIAVSDRGAGWRSRTCCAAAEPRHAAPAIGRRGASPRRRRR